MPFVWNDAVSHIRDSTIFLPVEGVNVIQQEEIETKRSLVTITLPSSEKIAYLEINAEGQKFFKRFGQLTFFNDVNHRRKKRRKSNQKVDVELNSEKTLKVFLDEPKVKSLSLIIENEDNPPLRITNVVVKQKQHYLIAYLEKNQDYKIVFGNHAISSPNYDLEYFTVKLPKQLKKTVISNIHRKSPAISNDSFYKRPVFIWTTIVIVIGILGFATLKMVKDLNKVPSKQ